MALKLLNTKEAAAYLGVSPAFLERDRCYEARIPFVRIASRTIRYRPDHLDLFIESHVRRSTSDVA